MGWTGLHKEAGESVKNILHHEFSTRNTQVLDSSVGLKEAYLVVGYKEDEGEHCAGQTFAVICLLQHTPKAKDGITFSYKAMDETELPHYFNCPERILKQLTPTQNQNAKKWREQCWARVKFARAKNGEQIRFNEEIKFSNGDTVQQFKVKDVKKNLVEGPDGFEYKIKGLNRRTDYTVVSNTASH